MKLNLRRIKFLNMVNDKKEYIDTKGRDNPDKSLIHDLWIAGLLKKQIPFESVFKYTLTDKGRRKIGRN